MFNPSTHSQLLGVVDIEKGTALIRPGMTQSRSGDLPFKFRRHNGLCHLYAKHDPHSMGSFDPSDAVTAHLQDASRLIVAIHI
jgi:hypothetical protein